MVVQIENKIVEQKMTEISKLALVRRSLNVKVTISSNKSTVDLFFPPFTLSCNNNIITL